MKFKQYTDSIINEMSSLSRIHDKTEKYTCGVITAFRGDKVYKENIKNNRELAAYLLREGYSVTKIKGAYIENYGKENQEEVGEDSFFVCNHRVEGDDGGQLLNDLLKLGEVYNQDSILYVPFSLDETKGFLFGTSKDKDAWVPYHQKMFVGFPTYGHEEMGEFFSRVRGRKFAFKECVEIKIPQTRNGKWGLKLLAEKVEKRINEIQI